MQPPDPSGPNADQIRFWNDEAGSKWVTHADWLDAHIDPLGRLAMDRAEPSPGQRVLDIGCGCGQTTRQLAQRVSPGGHVTGLDISARMLAEAQRRARQAGLETIRFQAADAQTHPLAAEFDRVFSRFGVMFFADPPAAFANLRRALVPGGRLVFVCWQELRANPWAFEPLLAGAKHVELPPPPAPGEPGPFALADPERIRAILDEAGYQDVEVEGVETELSVGGGLSLDEATEMMMQIGPTARVLQASADESARGPVRDSIREVLARHETADGVRMGAAVWVVSAR
jgi:SAM-dependent methyltransferase